MSTRRVARIYGLLKTPFTSALVGAVFGVVGFLLTSQYQQVHSDAVLRAAFAAEIDAILVSVRLPSRKAAESWEGQKAIQEPNFYYPHAIFDGNVARLGELRDGKLVHDISSLYAMLELAREEGRRLKAGVADPEGTLRYLQYLISAFTMCEVLIFELTGEPPKISDGSTEDGKWFNNYAFESDHEFLKSTSAKIWRVILPPKESADKKK
jgi:hypothetical protein